MGLIASKKNRVAIPPLEEGTYAAVCIGIVDLGEQFNDRYGKYQDSVMFTFEVVGETVERGNGPEPRWLSREYTKTMGEKSNLYKDLTKWHGALSEADENGFDLLSLLGKACLISVVIKERQSGEKDNRITGTTALPKGMSIPKAQSETFLFDMDNPDTYSVLESLPRFMREKIEKSTTWARLHAGSEEMDMDGEGAVQNAGALAPSTQADSARVPSNIDPETGEIIRKNPTHVPF